MGRAKRNAVDVDVEDRQGVCDGIGHGRHSTDDSSLTYTLEPADRVYGWGFDVVDTAIGDVQRRDRKSTRLNSSTNAHLVCRLLIEKKKRTTMIPRNIDKQQRIT